jgi:tRNA(Arg) A34 adenosine deaminase TadA
MTNTNAPAQSLFDQTLELMLEGFDQHAGLRPFGALITKGEQVISTGVNTCIRDQDPTAHAEINAIRSACKALGRTNLSECVIIASAQPCPMCQAACFHAGLKTILTITTWQDYSDLFPDQECAEWMHNSTPSSRVASAIHRQRGQDLWDRYRKTRAASATQPNHTQKP